MNPLQLLIATMLCSTTLLADSERRSPRDPASGVAIAREFLASLDDATRKSVQFAFDVAERKRWRRDPSPRPGIAMKNMTGNQRALVNQLLESVLADAGLTRVRGIMKEQDHLAEGEESLGSA